MRELARANTHRYQTVAHRLYQELGAVIENLGALQSKGRDLNRSTSLSANFGLPLTWGSATGQLQTSASVSFVSSMLESLRRTTNLGQRGSDNEWDIDVDEERLKGEMARTARLHKVQ